jgi:segregation and condensation protein B
MPLLSSHNRNVLFGGSKVEWVLVGLDAGRRHRFTRRYNYCKFLCMNTATQQESASQEPLEQAVEVAPPGSPEATKPPAAQQADSAMPGNTPETQEFGEFHRSDSAGAEDETRAPEETEVANITADQMPLRQVLEALLFASDVPLSAAKITQTLGLDSARAVKLAVEQLNDSYNQREAAFRIEERAGGYQILTLPQYAEYIQRLMRKRDEGRLTPAALETLAIIAYKQPILRVDVEAIRGVACGEVIRTLMEYNLVKIVGRAEDVGRPMLYGTTRHFLEVFGLSSLKDLPKAEQLKEPV